MSEPVARNVRYWCSHSTCDCPGFLRVLNQAEMSGAELDGKFAPRDRATSVFDLCDRCEHTAGRHSADPTPRPDFEAIGRPMVVEDLDDASRKRLEDAWAQIVKDGGPSRSTQGSIEKMRERLASARKEADELLGLLMRAPGFACGGVTSSTVVYTRNGRAYHAVIHDVTDRYTDPQEAKESKDGKDGGTP